MNQDVYSKTGSRLIPAQPLKPRKKKMASALCFNTVKGLIKTLIKEMGILKGLSLLLKVLLWDLMFNKPRWHAEKFSFTSEKEAMRYKAVFDELVIMIILYNNLNRKYGEEFADKLTAKLGVPCTLPYAVKFFPKLEKVSDIDEVRQLISDFHGEGSGYVLSEMVAEDKSEVHYCYSKCPHTAILNSYGLHAFSGYVCITDHIVFDNLMPGIVFSRSKTLGVDNDHCNHKFRIRKEDDIQDESNYEDCMKVMYDSRDVINKWGDIYRSNKGSFKF